jgi:hypothetical protein
MDICVRTVRYRLHQRRNHWPADVRSISLEGLEFLGVDSTGRIYWDGKPVEITRTFSLTWWQKVGAVATVVSAVAVAVVEWLQFLGDMAPPLVNW